MERCPYRYQIFYEVHRELHASRDRAGEGSMAQSIIEKPKGIHL